MSRGRPRVVLGVSGGIAAYKSCELLRLLTESGHDVRVVPTADALRFVGATTFEALSGHPVVTDVWTGADEVPHVALGRSADVVVVAPATADLLARAAAGRADDLLTATLLTARCPLLFAPAMHTEMWEHPATRANVATLRSRGAVVVDPAVGRLTGRDSGAGRLPEPVELHAAVLGLLALGERAGRAGLAGRRVVVTAGGTREFLDPVRFLGNRSSGRQGYALARAAVLRGAEVALVAANVALPDPAGAAVVPVSTAEELREATLSAAAGADAVVMAAAVADFRPARRSDSKIKKGTDDPPPVDLVRTADVLAELGRPGPDRARVVVGFAVETHDAQANARDKLERKNCDLLVLNEVGPDRAFESADNAVRIFARDGSVQEVETQPKDAVAHRVWDAVERLLDAR